MPENNPSPIAAPPEQKDDLRQTLDRIANALEKRNEQADKEGGDQKEGGKEGKDDKKEGGDKKEGEGGDKDKDKEDDKNKKPGKIRRFFTSVLGIIITLVVLALLVIAVIALIHYEHTHVSTDDAYTTGHTHMVSPRVAGFVLERLVDDNQDVKAGQLLIKLDPKDYQVAKERAQAELDQSKANVVTAQAAVVQAKAGVEQAQAQVSQARAQTSQAGAQYQVAGVNYGRNSALFTKDTRAVAQADVDTTKSNLDASKGAFDAAKANTQAAEANVDSAKAMEQNREAELVAAQAAVETSQANLDNAELQLSYCNVLAPVNGRVSKRTVEVGQQLSAGQALMSITPSEVWVLANYKETQLSHIRVGQTVNVPIDAFKDHGPFVGRVDSIQNGSGATYSLLPPDNATGNFTKIVQRVPVKITFDAHSIKGFEDLIVPGLSCEPTVDLASPQRPRRLRGGGASRAAGEQEHPAMSRFSFSSSGRYSGRRMGVLCAVVLVLAGCKAVGPDYHGPPAPEAPNPARFKNAAADQARQWKIAEPKDMDARGDWWEIFGDPDLNRLEGAATANNQNLRLAAARIAESRAQTRVAASDFYPNANYEPSYVRERMSNNEPYQTGQLVNPKTIGGGAGGAGGGTTGGTTGGGALTLTQQPLTRTYSLFRQPVDLNWELDIFGRVRRNTEAARADAQASQADYQNMILSVAANVANTYYNVRALDTEIEVINRTIHARQDALGIAQERLSAGLTGELDVVRERSELATDRADLEGVKRSREEMENALATLVGQPASTFHFAPHEIAANAKPPHIPAGLPSRLLERRPDVAEAERNLAASNARVGVAVAAFFPRITLTGAAGFESATVTDLFNWQSHLWQIGPSINLPIFEGFRNQANLQAAHARYDQSVAQYRQQVLVAFQDVENALADLRTLAAQSEQQNLAVEASRRTLQLSQDQYRNGAVTFLDVVDAERTLFDSERTAAQLLGQRLQATVQLIKALGGGWG